MIVPEEISSIELNDVDRRILAATRNFYGEVYLNTRVARLLYEIANGSRQIDYLDKLERKIEALEQKIKTARLQNIGREEEEEIQAVRESFRDARSKLLEAIHAR